jgi:hypothetical protein
MPNVQSPATVLALLKKAKGTYAKKKPNPKSKPEERHNEIVKGLQRLREMARLKGKPGSEKLAKPFTARKKLLLKKLTEHRKKINSATEKNDDANKAQLPAYTKALLKLTRVVLGLDFATVTADPETGVNLDGLEEGDPAQLDHLDALSADELRDLEQADDASLPETSDEDEQEGGELEEQPRQPETKPAKTVDGVALLKRFLALTGDYNAVSGRKDPEVTTLRTLYEQTRGLLDGKQFAAAAEALEQLEPLLARLKQAAPSGPGPGRSAVGWQTARADALNKLRQLEAKVAKTKDPLAGETVALIEGIVKRLSAEVSTPQSAADMANFVRSDAGISDLEATSVENVSYAIRAPLLKALEAMRE